MYNSLALALSETPSTCDIANVAWIGAIGLVVAPNGSPLSCYLELSVVRQAVQPWWYQRRDATELGGWSWTILTVRQKIDRRDGAF